MAIVFILQKLTVFAASQGKSLDQLITALLDAGHGEFVRLQEFGIRARQLVDGTVHVVYQGQMHTLANTPDALSAFILDQPVTYSINELGDQVWQLKELLKQIKQTPLDSAEAGNLRFVLQMLRFRINEVLEQIKTC